MRVSQVTDFAMKKFGERQSEPVRYAQKDTKTFLEESGDFLPPS
jgi:hypothetical protein